MLYELSVMHSLAAPTTSTPVEVGTVLSALRYCPGETLYPELVSQALQWAIYIGVLLGLAVTMLWRHDDEHTSLHLGIWIWVALLGALVSLGGIGLMQFLATSQKCLVLPPVILQASCWTMLALFVLLARGLRNVTRVMRFSPGVLFWARIVLLLAWLLPSDNCSVVRHHLYEWFTAGLRESDKPMRLQELRDRHVALREMEAIGLWLRKNTPADTLIVTNQPRMRVCARRGVLVIQSDVTMLVQHAPWLIETWHRLNSAQDRWFSKPIDPKVIADGFRKITAAIPYHARLPHEHCYLLLPAHTNLVEVHPLEDIRNPDWGQQYRLLRLPK
ncbi:MAG: hypothetical protein HN909_03985 [Phycisphaerales bacterium]|nr:hypothetical protein [Phycisphaerales bacterium]